MVTASKVVDIPIKKITVSPLHFDRTHSEENLEKLMESIREVGLIHPLTVRKKGNIYELLAGERRLRALKALGRKEVRVTVVSCDDFTAELLSIEENFKGTEPMTPAEEKRAIDRAVEIVKDRITSRPDAPEAKYLGASNSAPSGEKQTEYAARAQAAKELGVSVSKVDRVRNLEKLIPVALRAYERKQISKQQATLLAGMPKGKQREELPKMIRESQRESTNRVSLEQRGGKDGDYKMNMREVNKLSGHCTNVSLVATGLMKSLSPEVAADIEEEAIQIFEEAKGNLEKLLTQIYETATWAKGEVES